MSEEKEYPMFSVIIPMYNAEDTIRQCISSIKKAEYPSNKVEIFVVDDGSNDKSVEIAKAFDVQLLYNKGNTISSVRNTGAKNAKGKILGFVDSDCMIDKMWLINSVRALSSREIGAVGCGYVVPENCSWLEKAWLYESKHKPFKTDFIPSGNFVVKNSIFQEVGGFDEELETCEDADICLRIIKNGYDIINSSDIKSVHLRNPKTVRDFFKKEMWYGLSMLKTLNVNIFDKVFIATCFFFFAHIFLFVNLIGFFFLNYNYENVFYFVFFILCIIVFSALIRIKRSKKIRLFLNITFLYYIYYSARTFGILKNFFKKY